MGLQRADDRWTVDATRPIRYDVHLVPGAFETGWAHDLLGPPASTDVRHLVIMDSEVARLHGTRIASGLDGAGTAYTLRQLPAGEERKTVAAVEKVARWMLDAATPRRIPAVTAVGGGVVLDIVGYAAASYARGVPWLRVPTTLVGLVDAGVGAKVGVDFAGAKNKLGAYWPADVTVADPTFLRTLPRRHIANGLAEIVKVAIMRDASLFALLERHGAALLNERFQGESPATADAGHHVLAAAIDGMLAELAPNLTEAGDLRRPMDFGHTASPTAEMHALPALLHGEAVALDMAMFCAVAQRRGLLSQPDLDRVLRLLHTLDLPIWHSVMAPALVLQGMATQTIHRGGAQHIPLPRGIGAVTFVEDVTDSEIRAALGAVRLASDLLSADRPRQGHGEEQRNMDELTERARRVMPGGVSSGRRDREPMAAGRGARLITPDGRKLVDNWCGASAIMLGHADPDILQAVTDAWHDGVLLGVGVTPYEVQLAERVVRHVPSADRVAFCESGSAATAYALRAARAATGRDRVLLFEGCYHGWHDAVWAPGPQGPAAGLVSAVTDLTIRCRYNALQQVADAFRRYPDQIAAVMVEPIALNGPGIMPAPGFLEGLLDLCVEHGAVLVFDEVITGFSIGLGGAQERFGVTPHLTTAGKAVANGVPIGMVMGRGDLMDQFNTHPDGNAPYSGTFNGGTLAMSAALATLDRLADGNAYAHLERLGERMRAGLAQIAADAGIEATVCGLGRYYTLWFGPGPLVSYDDTRHGDHALFVRYRRGLIQRGVYEKPNATDGVRGCLMEAHTDADVDLTLTAARDALRDALDGTEPRA